MGSVTIRDIAQKADVSVATVSRALNHSPLVSESMQKRVIQTAKRLGYVPNTTAKNLKTNTTHTIGILVSDISNPDYIAIIRTIEDTVSPYGYNLILCSTGDSMQRERDYLNMLYSRGIDGLILNTTDLNNDLVIQMCTHIPIVLLNRNISDNRFRGDYVSTDNYNGIYQLTNFLLSLGHHDIYVIAGPNRLSNNRERFRGFYDAMQAHGYAADTNYPYCYCGAYTQQTGVDAIREFMLMKRQPSAILSFSNIPMLGALHEIARSTFLRIPEEISLASYDSIPNIELLSIRPVTARFDNTKIGKQCASAVLDRINDPTLPNRQFVFEPTIVPGNAASFFHPEK